MPLLSGPLLQRLNERRDGPAGRQLAFHLTLLAVGALLWGCPPLPMLPTPAFWALRLVGLLLLGWGLAFGFCAMHECGHRTAFASKGLNDAVAWWAGLLSFYNADYYRRYHQWHHRFTHQPGLDPELEDDPPSTLGGYLLELSGLPWWTGKLRGHAAGLRAMIDPARAGAFRPSDFPTHKDTIYLSCVDAEGTAISFINSLFSGFGSAIMAPESGVMLQNRGRSFRLEEGHVNVIAPRKRPMHTIIPGMVFKDGQAVAPFGVMGGQYQSTGHANFLSNVLDLGMDIQEAMDAPRSFALAGKLQVENTFAPATLAALEAKGHVLEHMEKPLGGSQAVWIDRANGCLIAGSDPRKDGCAMGY